MNILPDDYCGDEVMAEYLRKADSKILLPGLYGLLYGCLAAPNMVMPSRLIPIIFGEEGANFKSEEEANAFFTNLMFLWNILAHWEPGESSFLLPDIKYPNTDTGFQQRAKDNLFLIEWFMKGLDLGETGEDDFTDEALNDMETLASVSVLFANYAGVKVFKEEDVDKNKIENSFLIDDLEGIMAGCIAGINLGLKEARIRVAKEMRDFADVQQRVYQARSKKIPRNEPCPCGSGKKYKKCCGITQ